ncbi:MAG: GNAT family N-acetyltransferase [Methanoregula sp.]|nr:GNAT family N-acetyltransferase [Methanoregula sp.]
MYDDMIPAAPAIHIQRIQDVHGTSHATNFYASAEETFQGQWIMRIRTPTSILRDWGSGDIGSLVRHANNPRVAAMMRDGFPSPYTHEDARRFIDLATTPGPHLFLAIEVDGKACGGIGIHPLEDVRRRSAEIGYWLSESCWGRGIATDAVRAIVPVAFGTFDIIRLQAGIFSSNRASMRVLEKCGFVREAVHTNAITKNGMTMDEIVYVCLQ